MSSAFATICWDFSKPNLFPQRAPLIDFFDRVGEIEGRIDEKKLFDADFALVGVDHAEVGALEGAQAYAHKMDRSRLEAVA